VIAALNLFNINPHIVTLHMAGRVFVLDIPLQEENLL